MLGIAKAMILTVSFSRLAPWLGFQIGIDPFSVIIDGSQKDTARQISQAIRVAARYTPWESNCFPQIIVSKFMLKLFRIPYVIFFGVRRDHNSKEIKAHAWSSAGQVRVTGGWSFDKFKVVGVFVDPSLVETYLSGDAT